MKRALTGAALVLGLSSFTSSALAFCRTTVCDPRYTCDQDPEICCVLDDATGCDINTAPISWPTSCVSYNVHEDGSKKLNIPPEELKAILDTAYASWLSVDCGGSGISLAVDYRGYAQCGSPEYNLDTKDNNANIWMFRDEGTSTGSMSGGGTLSAAALAVTTVSFNEDNAQIYDADVELLSYAANFTIGDEVIDVDLASVVVHEAGHFLGLDHSTGGVGPTMAAGYIPGTTTQRDLSDDDIAGICAAYPEGRQFPGGKTCEPRGVYSPECNTEKGCGCHQAGSDGRPATPMFLVALLLGTFAWRRRRLQDAFPQRVSSVG